MDAHIRLARLDDLPYLLNIYNFEVLNGSATFDTEERSFQDRLLWFQQHDTEAANVGNHPLIVAESQGIPVGYASLSPYRNKDAYASTVELSVYVDKDYRGCGIASALLERIIDMARSEPRTHVIVSVITGGNAASIHLHEKFGFCYSGCLHELGVKFGRYLDILNYELRV